MGFLAPRFAAQGFATSHTASKGFTSVRSCSESGHRCCSRLNPACGAPLRTSLSSRRIACADGDGVCQTGRAFDNLQGHVEHSALGLAADDCRQLNPTLRRHRPRHSQKWRPGMLLVKAHKHCAACGVMHCKYVEGTLLARQPPGRSKGNGGAIAHIAGEDPGNSKRPCATGQSARLPTAAVHLRVADRAQLGAGCMHALEQDCRPHIVVRQQASRNGLEQHLAAVLHGQTIGAAARRHARRLPSGGRGSQMWLG